MEQVSVFSASRMFNRNLYTGTKPESARSSRCSGFTIQSSNFCRTRSISADITLRWPLTRELLRECAPISFVIFTVIEEAVHVTLTQIRDGRMGMNQWIFSPEASIWDVEEAIRSELSIESRCYLFTPGRSSLRDIVNNQLGASLTREQLSLHFPTASIISLDMIARISTNVLQKRVGADTHQWLMKLMQSQRCADAQSHSSLHEFLTSSAKTDAAIILRILVTPTQTWMTQANFRKRISAIQKCV